MNALSLLFPAGERFFMDSVRNYRDQIEDPELKKQVLGFIGQEAMHTREHIEYNDLLQASGLPAHKLDKRLWTILGWFKKVLPHSMQLAITIALEHTRRSSRTSCCRATSTASTARSKATSRCGCGTRWRKPSTRRCRTTCGAP